MCCSKMAEPIEMPFAVWMLTHVGPRKVKLPQFFWLTVYVMYSVLIKPAQYTTTRMQTADSVF